MMDQSLMSCYYPLSPIPPVHSLFSPECTLISISSNSHLSGSMAYFTSLNLGVTFSAFILIALSATCDTVNHPSFLRHFVHMAFGPPCSQLSIYLIGCSFSASSDDSSFYPCPLYVKVSQAFLSSSAHAS